MHLTQDELSEALKDAKQKVAIGAVYRHYKSSDMTYRVKDIVIHEADNEPHVVYQAEYGNKITFTRPVSVWLEKVTYGGRLVPRFTEVEGA